MTASGHRLRSAVTQAPDARAAVLRSVGTTTRHRACPPRPRGAGAKPRRSRGGGGQPCGVWWCRRCPAPGQPTSCSCRARPTARGAWSNGARAARGAAGQAAGAQPGPSGPGAPGRPPERRGGDVGAPGRAKSGPTARATAGSGAYAAVIRAVSAHAPVWPQKTRNSPAHPTSPVSGRSAHGGRSHVFCSALAVTGPASWYWANTNFGAASCVFGGCR